MTREPRLQRFAQLAISGTDAVNDKAEPVMGAQDFAYMLNARSRPGALVFLGKTVPRSRSTMLRMTSMMKLFPTELPTGFT